MPSCFLAFLSVRTSRKIQLASCASVVQVFCPLTTQWSPSSTASQRKDARSEPLFGSEEHKRRFLPATANLDIWWCQGFSEPGSGSDLASLRTTARREGDEYVVNGQKTWTTLATDANWIFLLVRTDKQAKKQEGISFLLVDMATPGITVRPIVNIELHDEFCEVFFDNVRVPKENLVGQLNKGWDMAKALLGFERIFIGAQRQSA